MSSTYKGSYKGSSRRRRPSLYSLQQPPQPQQQQQQQQEEPQQPFPSTVTSAIFGSTFERTPHSQQQQQLQQPVIEATSLIMNGSYFMGPRAPQYIPSPLSSPVSPSYFAEKSDSDSALLGVTLRGQDDGSAQDSVNTLNTAQNIQFRPPLSQGSLSAAAADLLQQEHHHTERKTQSADSILDRSHTDSVFGQGQGMVDHDDSPLYDDNIKVDVTELYENFGQKNPIMLERREDVEEEGDSDESSHSWAGRMAAADSGLLSSSLPLKLPELSFSNNDLSSLLAPGEELSFMGDMAAENTERRTRAHTFHGDLENIPAALPLKKSSLLKSGHNLTAHAPQGLLMQNTENFGESSSGDGGMEAEGPSDDLPKLREHVGLAATDVGLADSSATAIANQGHLAAMRSNLERSALDLPSWDLAPLSSPTEVKETATNSAAVSLMNARRSSVAQPHQQQDSPVGGNHYLNGIIPPAFATMMTPMTPLTNRETRILAGRETLSRTSPDKSRGDRSHFGSSTISSVASAPARPASSASTYTDRYDADTLVDSQVAYRRASIVSQGSQMSQQTQLSRGVFGAVPERGQLTDVPAEKLVFPDQSIRPIPLKAYRIRKMTLKERNQTYTQACEEFTRARTGLDVWALRCMLQDRPALMKEPPAIVKAVAGKHTAGLGHQQEVPSKASTIASGRMTPTVQHFNSSSISGQGFGARIKNAGKRLSMDASVGPRSLTPDPSASNSTIYKQKTTRSTSEVESWSHGRARGISNTSVNTVSAGSPQVAAGHRHSIATSMASSSPQQQSSSPLDGSRILTHNKRHSIGVVSGPLSNTVRNRTLSDVQSGQSGSRLNIVGRESTMTQNSGRNSPSAYQQQYSEAAVSAASYLPSVVSNTGAPMSGTSSVFKERPMQRRLSANYTRRPASAMATTGQRPSIAGAGESTSSGSNMSIGSQSSSSIGSALSHSLMDSLDLKSTSTISSLNAGLKQQQLDQQQSLEQEVAAVAAATSSAYGSYQPAFTLNRDGTPIPYADATKSKDEIYSPLTSPIMIPAGGFPAPRSSFASGYHSNGGWSSPQSAGGGMARPLTYAGSSSSTLNSNSSLVMSPKSSTRESTQNQKQQKFPQGYGSSALERGDSSSKNNNSNSSALEPMKDKPEKGLSRYSTATFSSIQSFAKYQKRSSKKDRKKELQDQQQMGGTVSGGASPRHSLDQRYAVSSTSMNQTAASANDHYTEQSLDKLSDVLPHVDRDRLSIYLQRACGDEMVAIGLAMSDFRSGQL
ncbi:hypothetical protein EDD11_005034 [Mortierella claussenii]|nr:hypothetical protein EDD11_005034 [Mortierella claussenii]